MSSSKRHFTAVVGSKEHGLYISSSPSSAARKIVSKLCAASKSKKVEFCVREITQGSKKKTYGPYLGEMKKLAKPIELKGRVIRYAPVVHLKKKKTSKNTVKKIGKKMRGGAITDGGELSNEDFLITDVRITSEQLNFVPNISHNYGGFPRPLFHYKIENYNYIPPCRLIRKNDRFQEPFIFWGKKIIGKLIEGENLTYSNEPSMYYEYVAFNEGRFPKTAKFKQFTVQRYLFPNIDISEIPEDALIQLRDFILQQRTELHDPTFCNTIYTAVVQDLERRSQQNN